MELSVSKEDFLPSKVLVATGLGVITTSHFINVGLVKQATQTVGENIALGGVITSLFEEVIERQISKAA